MDVAVQIEFLGTPQLANPSSPRVGEWPPAPDRLFQALVATAAETGKVMEKLKCLEAAPEVAASEALLSPAPKRYVPENFRRPSRYHQGALRYLPTVMPESPVVTYVWKNIPETTLPSLRTIVESVTHVGRAASLVRGTLVDASSVQTTWVPAPGGDIMMRVPYPGRLADLQEAYQKGLRPPVSPSAAYKTAESIYPASEWGELMVLRPERPLAMSQTVRWAATMRKAVMSKAPEQMPAFIHGHGEHRHLAWTALPDVGHRYASGMILGLGCWLPADISLEERGLIGSLMMQVTDLEGVRLQIDHVGLKGLQKATWSRASRFWATATPLALDRWPKRNTSAADIVSQSLQGLGYPEPVEIICDNQSSLTGAVNARNYPARNRNRFITHAVIVWERPVAGPLLIGADRYFGSGLCRPITTWRGGNA